MNWVVVARGIQVFTAFGQRIKIPGAFASPMSERPRRSSR